MIFALNRVKKIYPIYITSLLFCMPYEFFRSLGKGYTVGETIRNIGIKMIFCVPLLQSALGMEALDRAINNVCWFLSSLFMIYSICPLLMYMISRVTDKWINIVFIAIVAVTLVVFWLLSTVQKLTFFDDLNYGSPYFRIWFVILGMLIERIYRCMVSDSRKFNFAEYSVVLGAIVWFFNRNYLKEYVYICRLIDILICAMLLLVIALGNGKIAQFLSRKRSILLGNMSMYVFIVHFPVILYIDSIFSKSKMRLFLKNTTGIVETAFILTITAVIVLFIAKRKEV